jgi:uncharacterized protein
VRLRTIVAVIVAWCAMLPMAGAEAQSLVPIPPYSARVIDLTGTLSGETVNSLEAKLKTFEETKGSQIAVLIVPTTQPEEIEQYSIRVADAWKPGRKKVEDGAILLIAKNDVRMRIEVGYGLEGVMPDAIAKRIIAETIAPHFKAGDFDGGVEAGVDRMIDVVNGEPLPEPDKKWDGSNNGLSHSLPLLLVVVFVVSGVLRSIFGRIFGSAATGALAGGIAWMLSHVLPIGLGAGALAFLFALVLGSSRSWSSGGGGWGGGLGGGGFGGRGGFGGGGGGFGGGGGGFGGGGASGGW